MISESGLWWFVRIATIIPKREHKEVRMSFDIAQSPMLMAAYEAGWDGAMRHLGGMSVDDAIMEILLERMIDIAFEDETV